MKRTYHTLAVDFGHGFGPEFGDYDREAVEQERHDQIEALAAEIEADTDTSPAKATRAAKARCKIITTDGTSADAFRLCRQLDERDAQ